MVDLQGKKIFFQSLVIFFAIIFFAVPLQAKAFMVSPPLVEIETEKGDSLIQKITLYNDVNQTITIYPSVENFNPTQIGKKTTEEFNQQNPSSWIKPTENKIVLAPGAKKDVLLNIKINDLVEPGGYYAAVFWSDHPAVGGVSTANRLATLFFFKIKGEVKEKLTVASFNQETLPNNTHVFGLTLENQGNVHVQPEGQLQIFNWRHNQINLFPINSLKQYLLPQSSKKFEVILDKTSKLSWGWYYADAKITYGANNQEIVTPEIKFWVLPAQWLSWIIGGVLIIILLFIIKQLVGKKRG